MTVSTEIQKIKIGVKDTYIALEAKGATLPEIESLSNLATTVATIPSGGDISSVNVYTLSFLEEVEDGIRNSSLDRSGLAELNILTNQDSLTPLRDTWVFKPADMKERFKDVLYSGHIYAEQKLMEILGETNE